MEKLTKLKEIRQKKNLSRKELAERSGISQDTINALESGYTQVDNIKLSTLIALAKALKTRVRHLVDDDLKKLL